MDKPAEGAEKCVPWYRYLNSTISSFISLIPLGFGDRSSSTSGCSDLPAGENDAFVTTLRANTRDIYMVCQAAVHFDELLTTNGLSVALRNKADKIVQFLAHVESE